MGCLVSCAEDFDFVLSVEMSREDFEQSHCHTVTCF